MSHKKANFSLLHVDEEYRSLLPPLSQRESEALKRSIREDGLHFPIIVNKRGVVLDGHNRLKVCRELGIKPRFEVRDFSNDRLQEKKFVIVSNLRRRHLNDFQKIELSQPPSIASMSVLTSNPIDISVTEHHTECDLIYRCKIRTNPENDRLFQSG